MSKIAVYAGHGGRDSGAVGQGGEMEKDYTLKIAQAAIKALEAAGHTVITNRTEDVERDISADAARANSEGVDCVAEVHLNSNDGAPASGSEVFCSITGGRGRELAQAALDKLVSLGYKSRGVKTRLNSAGRDCFGIIRQTKAPAVLVEVCFINNPDDMARLDVKAAGAAIAAGIEEVYGAGGGEGANVNSNENADLQKAGERRKAKTAEVQRVLNVCYAAGLAEDGIWGPKTAAACSAHLLKNRSPMIRTTYVTLVQQLLCEAGFDVDADGAFGPKTAAQTAAFQKSAGLSADGIVGKDTCKALVEAYAVK